MAQRLWLACIFSSPRHLKTIAMGFQPWYWTSKGNLLDHTYDDILANWIDSRRDMMFANYRSGQNVEYRRRQNTIRTELKRNSPIGPEASKQDCSGMAGTSTRYCFAPTDRSGDMAQRQHKSYTGMRNIGELQSGFWRGE